MRIGDEVDALESMAVPSLPFLVTTRMLAAFVAVIPLYLIGLLARTWPPASRSSFCPASPPARTTTISTSC